MPLNSDHYNMASYGRARYPMQGPNFPRDNFGMNSGMGRPPIRPFQPGPFGQFQSYPRNHEPGMQQAMFQNRPRFSNFAERPPGFRNRSPLPECMPPPNMGPPLRPRFPGAGPFERHFLPWDAKPFLGARPPFRNRPRAAVPPSFSKGASFSKDADNKPKRKRLRQMKVKEDRKLKPWMTDEIFEEVQKKNALYFKAKKTDNAAMWQEFRLQRNRVSSLIKDAKLKAGLITRKIKEEEDDGVEKPFSCDTCDRAFISDGELKSHLSEHVKCDSENCHFEAHPKVVAIHKKMQHETGYAEAINKLKDEEEIKKWIEERKSRFPTAENILKRKAEQTEKEARGEVLETKEFGKFKRQRSKWNSLNRNDEYKSRNHHKHNDCRNFDRFKRNRNFTRTSISQPAINDSDSDSDSHIMLKKFSGISSITEYSPQNDFIQGNGSTKNILDTQLNIISTSKDHQLSKINNEHNLNDATNDKSNHCIQPLSNNDKNCLNNASVESNHHLCLLNGGNMEDSQSKSRKFVTANEKTPVIGVRNHCVSKNNPVNINNSGNDSSCSVEIVSQDKVKNSVTAITAEDSRSESRKFLRVPANEETSVTGVVNPCASKNNPVVIIDSDDDDSSCSVEIVSENIVKNNVDTITVEDSDDEAPEEIPIIKGSQNETEVLLYPATEFTNGKVVKLEKTVNLNESVGEDKSTDNPKCIEKNKNYNGGFVSNGKVHPAYRSRKSTLLEKLLADDIRHERNVILQCIRHVVKSNYFGVGSASS